VTVNVIKSKNRKEKTNNELCVMNYFDWQITALRHISTSSLGAAQDKIVKLKIIGNRFTKWMTLKVNYRLKNLKTKV
jgi:hypothetical protein